MPSVKEQVLERLSLIQDEPEEENLFFSFDKYAKQVNSVVIDENTHTPFVIAIHGEWGSGKTSLIMEIQKLVKKEIEDNSKQNWHQLRFNVWEYERVDIISSLFQLIESEYANTKSNVTDFGKSVGLFLADAALRKGVGMSWNDTKDHFKQFINEIPNVKKSIESLTANGRLIIFVDDLDRCHIDNVLDMLEAIKIFLTVKNVIFVVAVDMKKVERAWKLRYQVEDGSIEGMEHIEKIFQLKLSLPPKEENEIQRYVELIINDSLSNTEKELIIEIDLKGESYQYKGNKQTEFAEEKQRLDVVSDIRISIAGFFSEKSHYNEKFALGLRRDVQLIKEKLDGIIPEYRLPS